MARAAADRDSWSDSARRAALGARSQARPASRTRNSSETHAPSHTHTPPPPSPPPAHTTLPQHGSPPPGCPLRLPRRAVHSCRLELFLGVAARQPAPVRAPPRRRQAPDRRLEAGELRRWIDPSESSGPRQLRRTRWGFDACVRAVRPPRPTTNDQRPTPRRKMELDLAEHAGPANAHKEDKCRLLTCLLLHGVFR